MRKIEIKESVFRDLKKVPKADIKRIRSKIESLNSESNIDRLKLVNSEFYKIRQGNYRIFFEYEQKQDLITVLKVSHRQNAYSTISLQ